MKRRVTALATALALTSTSTGIQPSALAATPSNRSVTDISIAPGINQHFLNINWRSTNLNLDPEYVQITPTRNLVKGAFPSNATTVAATRTLGTRMDFFNKATITKLQPQTEYSYRIGSSQRGWTPTYTFSTENFSDNWNFLFVGDPQLGASDNLREDTAGWLRATDKATSAFPHSSFLLSGGDQVETALNAVEYDAFLSNPTLREVPTAVVRGNHEFGSILFNDMYNMPGPSNDYYFFEHNNALVVALDANNLDVEGIKAYLRGVIPPRAASKDWVIVTFHQAPYSQAKHHNDLNVQWLRSQLAPELSRLGVDLVLNGHDHIYTRTHLMNGTKPVLPAGTTRRSRSGAVGDVLYPKDHETLYITASSSSGSKFYDFVANNATEPDVSTADSFRRNLPYRETAWWSQDETPDYTNIDIKGRQLVISTYNVEDNSMVDKVTLMK